MKHIYIDAEWFPNQKMFLLGYAYTTKNFGSLYGRKLTKQNLIKILEPVDGFIFFYGPDIALLEKNFNINIRDNYKCVNLIKVFRRHCPGLKSYTLANLEKKFGIKRSTQKYKANIFQLISDWKIPIKRQACIRYNEEDVINLIKVKQNMAKKYNLKTKHYTDAIMT